MIKIKKGKSRTFPLVTGVGPVGFDLAPDGNVAFTDFITGAVRKLVYSPNNKAPTAKIFANPTSGPGPNMLVNFSALDSTDPDGDPLQYDWDFDDGSPHDTSGGSVSHVYTANGELQREADDHRRQRGHRSGAGQRSWSATRVRRRPWSAPTRPPSRRPERR